MPPTHQALNWIFGFEDRVSGPFKTMTQTVRLSWQVFIDGITAATKAVSSSLRYITSRSPAEWAKDAASAVGKVWTETGHAITSVWTGTKGFFRSIPDIFLDPVDKLEKSLIRAGTGTEKYLVAGLEKVIDRAGTLRKMGVGADVIAKELDTLVGKSLRGIHDLARGLSGLDPKHFGMAIRAIFREIKPEEMGEALRQRLVRAIQMAIERIGPEAGEALSRQLFRNLGIKMTSELRQASRVGGHELELALDAAFAKRRGIVEAPGAAAGFHAAPAASRGEAGGGLGGFLSGILGPVKALFTFLGGMVGPTRLLMSAIAPVTSMLQNLIAPLLIPLTDALMSLITAVSPLVSNVLPALQDAFMTIIQAIEPILPILTDVLKQVLVALVPVITALMNFAGAVLRPLMSFLEPVLKAVGALAELLGPVLTPIIEGLSALIEPLIRVALIPLTIAFQLLTPVLKLLTPVLKFVADVIKSITEGIGQALDFLVDFVDDIVSTLTLGFVRIKKREKAKPGETPAEAVAEAAAVPPPIGEQATYTPAGFEGFQPSRGVVETAPVVSRVMVTEVPHREPERAGGFVEMMNLLGLTKLLGTEIVRQLKRTEPGKDPAKEVKDAAEKVIHSVERTHSTTRNGFRDVVNGLSAVERALLGRDSELLRPLIRFGMFTTD